MILIIIGITACTGSVTNELDNQVNKDKADVKQDDDATKSQKAALNSAKNYSDIMHMSKQGIYEQLTAKEGDDFSEDDAQYAVDHLKANYKENALESAKSYQEDQNMSKNKIKEQLTSSYGDQFTEDEAQYAVDNLED